MKLSHWTFLLCFLGSIALPARAQEVCDGHVLSFAVADTVNLRAEPDPNAAILAPLRIGQPVCVMSADANGWRKARVAASRFQDTLEIETFFLKRGDWLADPKVQEAYLSLGNLEGFVHSSLLAESMSEVTVLSSLEGFAGAKIPQEKVAYAERLFALKAGREDASRLARALRDVNETERAEAYEYYAEGKDRGVFGFCNHAITFFLDGSPYDVPEFKDDPDRPRNDPSLFAAQRKRLERTQQIWLRAPWFLAKSAPGEITKLSPPWFALASVGKPKTERSKSINYFYKEPMIDANDYERLDLFCQEGFVSNQPFEVVPLSEEKPPAALRARVKRWLDGGHPDWPKANLPMRSHTIRRIAKTEFWLLETDYIDTPNDGGSLTRATLIDARSVKPVLDINTSGQSNVAAVTSVGAVRVIHRPVLGEYTVLIAENTFNLRDMIVDDTIYSVSISEDSVLRGVTEDRYLSTSSGKQFYIPNTEFDIISNGVDYEPMPVPATAQAEASLQSVWPFIDSIKVLKTDPSFGRLELRSTATHDVTPDIWAVFPDGREQKIEVLRVAGGGKYSNIVEDAPLFMHGHRTDTTVFDSYATPDLQSAQEDDFEIAVDILDPARGEDAKAFIETALTWHDWDCLICYGMSVEEVERLIERRAPYFSLTSIGSCQRAYGFDGTNWRTIFADC